MWNSILAKAAQALIPVLARWLSSKIDKDQTESSDTGTHPPVPVPRDPDQPTEQPPPNDPVLPGARPQDFYQIWPILREDRFGYDINHLANATWEAAVNSMQQEMYWNGWIHLGRAIGRDIWPYNGVTQGQARALHVAYPSYRKNLDDLVRDLAVVNRRAKDNPAYKTRSNKRKSVVKEYMLNDLKPYMAVVGRLDGISQA